MKKQLPSRTRKAKELLTGKKPKRIFKPNLKAEIYVKDGWTLYTRLVKLSDGREQRIYFFSKREVKNGVSCAKPEGYGVGVSRRTGLPYLKEL